MPTPSLKQMKAERHVSCPGVMGSASRSLAEGCRVGQSCDLSRHNRPIIPAPVYLSNILQGSFAATDKLSPPFQPPSLVHRPGARSSGKHSGGARPAGLPTPGALSIGPLLSLVSPFLLLARRRCCREHRFPPAITVRLFPPVHIVVPALCAIRSSGIKSASFASAHR